MFHQITKKIIALVTTVCLLVGVMVVPSAAADDTQMYLYNGVELPALPVWDKTTYPYVLIVVGSMSSLFGSQSAFFYAFSTPHHRNVFMDTDSSYHFAVSAGESYLESQITTKTENDFTGLRFTPEVKARGSLTYFASSATWSNYDVLDETGQVYLAASNPVFVVDDSLIYDDIPADNGPPVVETVPDSESIIEVLNSILEYDIATWNLLAYGTNRIRYIERYVGSILEIISPSEQETALKEATSDVTSAYTEKFWGADSDNALGSASITESADILSGTKFLFSTGVSTSDLFGLFGRESWGRWFSEETRADLHTVPDVAVIGLDEDDAKTEYEKNLDSIRDFMGR